MTGEYLNCKERGLRGHHYFPMSSDMRVKRLVTFLLVICLLILAVIGQECTDTIGSLSHDNIIVTVSQTFILADYTVPCSGTVVAWEFCYQISTVPVTFYPGIWKIGESHGGGNIINYVLVQSNKVTYDQNVRNPQDSISDFSCQIFNLSDTDQFTAPARSVVGLYSGIQFTQLLHTNSDSSIATYRSSGNQSTVSTNPSNNNDVDYEIAIRVHLLIPTSDTTTVTSTTSMVTSDTTVTTVTPTTSMVSTSDTTTVTPTTSIVSTSDATTVTSTTMISTSDTTTVTSTTMMSTSDTTTVTSTTMISTSDTTIVTSTTVISTSDATTVTSTTIISTSDTTTITSTTSIVSTSDTATVTPTTSMVSTSDTTTVTSTTMISTSDTTIVTSTTVISTSDATTVTSTTIISTSDTTTITSTTSIVSTSDTATVTPTTSMVSTSDTTTVTSIISTSDTIKNNPTVAPGAGSDIDGDSGGGSSIGIIVGAVIGILCIIVLSVVVILLWRLSRRRKRKAYNPQTTQNLELVTGKCDMSQESAVINDSSNYYSSVGNQPNAKHNGNVVYKNVTSEYEAPSDSFSCKYAKESDNMSPYSVSTGKSYSRFASNDYEAAPKLAEYETAIQFYSDITRESTSYDGSRMSEYSEVADATTVNDGEEIYSDPGHCKEDIYACFEKKKFRIIKRSDISIFQELGSGEFGIVHLGEWSDVCADPVKVAVKTLNSQCSESDRIKFLREAAIMGQFVHNNVVQLHGVVTEEENMMIVLEYMPKGDLREFLIKLKNTTLPETFNELKHDLLSYCRHISAGLSHLASKGFVHRDLAARNILVSSDDVCKIADFGMARDVTDDTYYVSSGGKVPLKWTAPEAIFYKKYSVQSDVWSFGCVMYEIWSLGYKPFEDLGGVEYVRKITTGYRLPPPPGCPRAIYELMIKCWHPVANKRIDSCSLNKALQQSDRALLPGTISAKDNEELSTGLGDPLATGSHLYQGLQNAYLGTIKQ